MKEELPSLKPGEVISALERAGFTVRRQTGSHVILYKPGLRRPLSIPLHAKEMPVGTLHAIIRQANLTVNEFLKLL